MTKEEVITRIKHSSMYKDDRETADYIITALEIVEDFERAQIITGGRLNGRTYAYKCGLEDGKRKALEQHIPDNATNREVLQIVFPSLFKIFKPYKKEKVRGKIKLWCDGLIQETKAR